MAKKVYDVAVKTGSYTGNDGQPKGRYENVGSVLKNDDGSVYMILKRTFNPAGVVNPDNRDSLVLSFFTPKDNNGQHAQQPAQNNGGYTQNAQQRTPQQQPQQNSFDNDIPF